MSDWLCHFTCGVEQHVLVMDRGTEDNKSQQRLHLAGEASAELTEGGAYELHETDIAVESHLVEDHTDAGHDKAKECNCKP